MELIESRTIYEDDSVSDFIGDLSYLKSAYNAERIDFYDGWSTGDDGYTSIGIYREDDGTYRIIVG